MKKTMTTQEKKTTAFNRALAGESVHDDLKNKYDQDIIVYNGVTHDDLYRYAKTIAYKVANNLSNGFEMNKDEDPLTYG